MRSLIPLSGPAALLRRTAERLLHPRLGPVAAALGGLLVLPPALSAQASVPVIATVIPQGASGALASGSVAARIVTGADVRIDSRLEVSGPQHRVVTAVAYRWVEAPGPREDAAYRSALPTAGEEVTRVALAQKGAAAGPGGTAELTYYSLRLQAPLEQSTTRLRVVYLIASPSH